MTIDSLSEPRSFSEAEIFVNDLLSRNEFGKGNEMNDGSTGFAPPKAYIRFINNVLKEMSPQTGKGLKFVLSQAALHILNPQLGMGKIWNPLTITGPIPYAGGLTTDTLDVVWANQNPGTRIAVRKDKLQKLYKGNHVDVDVVAAIPPLNVKVGYRNEDGTTLEQKADRLNVFTPNRDFNRNLMFDMDAGVVDPNQGNFKPEVVVPSVTVPVPDYTKVFNKKGVGPGFNSFDTGVGFYEPKQPALFKLSDNSSQSTKRRAQKSADVFFSNEDYEFGYIESELDTLIDDDFYVPVYLEDLRKQNRRVYFRAFLTSFTENYETDQNIEKYYGRIDPVILYKNTTRRVEVNLKIASFSPQGLSTMWKKINNFIKMIYPSFKNGVLHAAPVARLRIGDVIADRTGAGLPGIILNPEFNFGEATWEINEYLEGNLEIGKVPMCADLSFSFIIIHERSPHIDENYNFDTTFFRRMGQLTVDETEIGEREQAEEQNAIQEDQLANLNESEVES